MNTDDDKPIRFDRNQNSRHGGTSQLAKLLAMIVVVGVFVISAGLIATSNELASFHEDKRVAFWFAGSFAILMIDLVQSFVLGTPSALFLFVAKVSESPFDGSRALDRGWHCGNRLGLS